MLGPLSVRAKLLWLTMGVVIPLIIAGFFNLWSLWSNSRAQIEQSLEQQAQIAAGAFEQQISIHRQTLETVALLAGKGFGTEESLQSYLDSIVGSRPQWLDMRIVRQDGTVVAAQQSKPATLNANTVEKLVSEMRSGSSLIALPEASPDERLHVLMLAEPSGDNLVIGTLDISTANAVFDNLRLPADDIIAVFDSENRLVYRSRPQDAQDMSQDVEPPLFSALKERSSGVIEIRSPYDYIERAYGLAPVKTGSYVVAVGVPSVRLYRPARRQFAQQAIVGLLVAALSIVAAFQFAQQIVTPLSKLREAAMAFGSGDLSARAAPIGGGTIRDLELSFNQMADQIAEREEQLQALDKLKSEFVSSVSHELRTPLTTIKALTRVLQSSKTTIAEREEYLETIAAECDRQIDFVQELLDLSRIEAGAYQVSMKPIYIAGLLSELLATKAAAASARDLRFDLTVSPDLPPILTDGSALRQIMSEVVDNAIKYSDEGSEIAISARQENNWVRVDICDEGCGIDPGDLPHIFERFYRGGPSVPPETGDLERNNISQVGGVGLGLYIAKSLATQIRVELDVESPANGIGSGTRFVITLPVAAGASDA